MDVDIVRAIIGADSAQMVSAANAGAAAFDGMMGKIERASATLAKFGAGLSIAVSVPLTALAVDSIHAAGAADSTARMFNTVFRDIKGTANEAMRSVADDFDLAEDSAMKMLGTTGNLLTGMGMNKQLALELSSGVARLGSDIASFRNLEGGAEAAAGALTMALGGQTRGLREFGIVIDQQSYSFQSLVTSLQRSRNMTEAQAMAFAIFREAAKQSKNAIGDYAKNSGEFTQASHRMTEMLGEAREAFGRILVEGLRLDVAAAALAKTFKITAAALDALPGPAKTIIGLAALALIAIGPLLALLATLGFAISGIAKLLVQWPGIVNSAMSAFNALPNIVSGFAAFWTTLTTGNAAAGASAAASGVAARYAALEYAGLARHYALCTAAALALAAANTAAAGGMALHVPKAAPKMLASGVNAVGSLRGMDDVIDITATEVKGMADVTAAANGMGAAFKNSYLAMRSMLLGALAALPQLITAGGRLLIFSAIPAMISGIGSALAAALPVIGALALGAIAVYTGFELITETAKALWEAFDGASMVQSLGEIMSWITGINFSLSDVTNMVKLIGIYFDAGIKAIAASIAFLAKSFFTLFSGAGQNISTTFIWIADNWSKLWSNAWSVIKAFGLDVGALFKGIGENIWNALTGKDTDFTRVFAELGKNMDREMAKMKVSELKLVDPLAMVGTEFDKYLGRLDKIAINENLQIANIGQPSVDKSGLGIGGIAATPQFSQVRFAGAALQGTAEAVKAENTKYSLDSMIEKHTRETAANTAKIAKNSGGMVVTLAPASLMGS